MSTTEVRWVRGGGGVCGIPEVLVETFLKFIDYPLAKENDSNEDPKEDPEDLRPQVDQRSTGRPKGAAEEL